VEKSNKSTAQRPQGDRQLDGKLVTIDLPFFIKQIRSEKAWKKSDRNSITVFKSSGISIVLMALHKGAEMTDHTTEGLVNVQILKGEIKFKTNDQTVKLQKGHLLKLSAGVSHSLQAKKMTIFLLTIITTAGDSQSNHISNSAVEQEKLNGIPVISELV
jgi:quercetin dioxygenase-like cupin family protein